jgi:hypothetical protein
MVRSSHVASQSATRPADAQCVIPESPSAASTALGLSCIPATSRAELSQQRRDAH